MTRQYGEKTAVMIGAGNIGRGFVGAAFAASGYETVFIDVDESLVRRLNERGEYPLRFLSNDGGRSEMMVSGIRAVNATDLDAAANEIARATVCATAVGARAMPHIAPILALGVVKRILSGAAPLNTIVCENLMDAGFVLREAVRRELPAVLAPVFDEAAGFPEAVIGRMVPVQTDAMKEGDSLRVSVEKYAFLPVDKAGFIGAIPEIKGMVPLDGFEYYVKRKLYLHNLGHATVAYLGLLKGHALIADAVDDPDILYLATGAMRESATALAAENPGNAVNLSRHIDNLLYRFSNHALGDTCARVAADPARKLGKNDRLIGALENCGKFGLPSVYIAAAAAAAMVSLGGNADLEQITGLSPDSESGRLINMLRAVLDASLRRADSSPAQAITVLRHVVMNLSGDITIL